MDDHTTVTPFELIWRLRRDWLRQIDEGSTPILDTVIPHLESEAIDRFSKEPTLFKDSEPDRDKDRERWLSWWHNEASNKCTTRDPIGEAGDQDLSAVGRAAVNVLMAVSALRDAIEAGQAEKAAALAMLLTLEVEAMHKA